MEKDLRKISEYILFWQRMADFALIDGKNVKEKIFFLRKRLLREVDSETGKKFDAKLVNKIMKKHYPK